MKVGIWGFTCIHCGGQLNRLWGLFNSQRVGDCTLLLSSAASLLQAFAFYFRMHPGLSNYSPGPY